MATAFEQAGADPTAAGPGLGPDPRRAGRFPVHVHRRRDRGVPRGLRADAHRLADRLDLPRRQARGAGDRRSRGPVGADAQLGRAPDTEHVLVAQASASSGADEGRQVVGVAAGDEAASTTTSSSTHSGRDQQRTVRRQSRWPAACRPRDLAGDLLGLLLDAQPVGVHRAAGDDEAVDRVARRAGRGSRRPRPSASCRCRPRRPGSVSSSTKRPSTSATWTRVAAFRRVGIEAVEVTSRHHAQTRPGRDAAARGAERAVLLPQRWQLVPAGPTLDSLLDRRERRDTPIG